MKIKSRFNFITGTIIMGIFINNQLEPGGYQLKVEFTFPEGAEKLNETVNFTVGDY